MRTLIPACLVLAVWLTGLAPAQAALSLNEIMADPASDWDGDGEYEYRRDEWVEVFNPGPGTVELGGYLLSDNDGLWTYGFDPGTTLAAGSALVVFGSQSLAWQQAQGMPQYGFRLHNDGDTVCLWQFVAGDTLLADTHTYNTHEADDDRSTGRNPDGTGEWQIFDALNPYDGTLPPLGNGLPPTPGLPNSGNPPVPARKGSWSGVKGLFR
ncbi:MAG: lamin tail domain-containing protein [Candidatus Eisenbacteria bacterium]|uniref:Lamin tail domain-containing protein n=1 Tax=Eiseniibacteriota bacterium TaxID=2212470 RepID=A0A937XBJ4_UNCEI|nr:lamin tail domain-containing protein [Candidatus Eisenbacteria bacterium]